MENYSAMSRHICALIRSRGGTIPYVEVMREILAKDSNYFRQRFGRWEDLETTPESSRILGEMLGIWSMDLWKKLGKPERLYLVQLGPGRGTIMDHLIGSTCRFRQFSSALEIHLVESKQELMILQKQKLKHFFTSPCWHSELKEVPRGVPAIIIAHQFYDTLPIHQFEKTKFWGQHGLGWFEKLVEIDNSGQNFRFVLSAKSTPNGPTKDFFEQRLLRASPEELKHSIGYIQLSPEAWKLTDIIARRIAQDGGGALVIDYGEDNIIVDRLWEISKDHLVEVVEQPGSADMIAPVDFAAIKMAAKDVQGVSVYGPITQWEFLHSLGIEYKMQSLLNATPSQEQKEICKLGLDYQMQRLQNPSTPEERRAALRVGKWILDGDGPARSLGPSDDDANDKDNKGPNGVGAKFKVLSIVKTCIQKPLGFSHEWTGYKCATPK